jgi:hypothetical protein
VFLLKCLYLDVQVTLLNDCLSGMLMKLVSVWDAVGGNQFVLKEECNKVLRWGEVPRDFIRTSYIVSV